jgi:fructoselysine-6-P-deglycase FrlB-like protein
MNPIDAMQTEIGYQVQDLGELDLQSPASDCLFVGSGDSYVAGLAAQYFSGSQAICCYPVDIIKNPLLAKGRNLFVVSVSGNTQANVLAAKIAKKYGTCNTTALTAKPSSRLAKSCDQLITLKYRNSGIPTSGTISFTVSMIECLSLTTQIRISSNLGELYNVAEKQAERVINTTDRETSNSSKGGGDRRSTHKNNNSCYFILGNGQLYAIAMYGALKFNEVFGVKSFSYPTEEFCHSPLFSIKEYDQVIVIGEKEGKKDDSDVYSVNLNKRLNEEGFSAVHIGFKSSGVELLLQSTFFMQLLVLKLAQRYGLTSCYFLNDEKLLRVSSDFIYG